MKIFVRIGIFGFPTSATFCTSHTEIHPELVWPGSKTPNCDRPQQDNDRVDTILQDGSSGQKARIKRLHIGQGDLKATQNKSPSQLRSSEDIPRDRPTKTYTNQFFTSRFHREDCNPPYWWVHMGGSHWTNKRYWSTPSVGRSSGCQWEVGIVSRI